MQENREHVSRFSYFWREKVSEQERSDDFGTACGPFPLSMKPWFRGSEKQSQTALLFLAYFSGICYYDGKEVEIMNNNKIPVFRWLLMFWLCNVASVVLSQLGGSAAPNSSNGSALTVTGILGVVCVIAEFIPFYQLSRVSDRLRRAFTLNIIGIAATLLGLISILLRPSGYPVYAPAGIYVALSLIASAGAVCIYVSQFFLYSGLNAIRAERNYDFPSRLILGCFWAPLVCLIASILWAAAKHDAALQDYFVLPGQMFYLILLALYIRAAYKAEKAAA